MRERSASERGHSRRGVLAGTVGSFTIVAGCIDDGGTGSADGTDTSGNDADTGGADSGDSEDNGSEDDDATDTDAGTEDDPLEYEIVRYSHSHSPDDPTVELFSSEQSATDWLADRGVESDEVLEFLEATVFDTHRLVLVEGTGYHGGHEMVIESVDYDDETVEIDGAVVDRSGDDPTTQPVLAVGALVRVSVEGEPPSEFSVSLVDGDGSATSVGYGIESASEDTESAGSDE